MHHRRFELFAENTMKRGFAHILLSRIEFLLVVRIALQKIPEKRTISRITDEGGVSGKKLAVQINERSNARGQRSERSARKRPRREEIQMLAAFERQVFKKSYR